MPTLTKIGNVKGPRGDSYRNARIVTDDLIFDRITVTATGEATTVVNAGNVRGPQGLPGTGAVPADTAVAGYISTTGTSETKTALGGAVERETTQKVIHGGRMLKPIRVPTLLVVDSWPNPAGLIERILWQDTNGMTIYGFSRDSSLYKSTDGGKTWVHRAYLNWGFATADAMLKTTAGTLLAIGLNHTVRRSTDDGITWTLVATFQAAWGPLGTQSWCIDKVTGDIYYGEYGVDTTTNSRLYRSTDDGLTWPVFHEFPTGATDPERVRHIHAVQWDHITQRVWICVGDATDATGLYRVNDARTGVIAMVTNRMLTADLIDAPRAIGIMPFTDYIAWASDSTANPWLFRVARTELGKPNPVIERIYRINSTGWWTCKASANGSRWVFSAAQENRGVTAIDMHVHLYAVEDQGATVYEIATLPQIDDTLPSGSLQPIGLPEDQGEFFFMQQRGVGRAGQWKMRLGIGGGVQLPQPVPMPPVAGWKTVNSGPVTVPAVSGHAFHYDIAPTFARTLRIFDANVKATDGSAGRINVRVVNDADGTVLYTFNGASARQAGRQEWSMYVHQVQIAAGQWIRVEAYNVHATTAVAGMVTLTLGWGS